SPRGTSRSASAQREKNGLSYSRSTGTSPSGTSSPVKYAWSSSTSGWSPLAEPLSATFGSSCQTTRPSATTSSPTPQSSTSYATWSTTTPAILESTHEHTRDLPSARAV